VPSTVATVVRWTILKLSPVISSMFIVFHWPVVSGAHSIWQDEPSLKTSPGEGASGTGSARAERTGKATAKRIALNMVDKMCC